MTGQVSTSGRCRPSRGKVLAGADLGYRQEATRCKKTELLRNAGAGQRLLFQQAALFSRHNRDCIRNMLVTPPGAAERVGWVRLVRATASWVDLQSIGTMGPKGS